MRIPFVSLLLGALAGSCILLPAGIRTSLCFDYLHFAQGNWTGLVTGHWVHADISHLSWNLAALLILSAIIEQRSRRLLLASIAAGMVAVDLLLVSSFSDLERYCGLSGILNTLMGVSLYLCWQSSRSSWVTITGVLYLMKIALEVHSGQSVFTTISWPPYAMSHVAGLMGAPVALAIVGWSSLQELTRRNTHEHLVSSQ